MKTIRPIIYAGGMFAGMCTAVHAQPGAMDPSFLSGAGLDAEARCLALQPDGGMLVGGSFTTYDGYEARYLARIKQNGNVDREFQGSNKFDRSVSAIACRPDGMIYVAGSFRQYDDQPAWSITRLNAEGNRDMSFPDGIGEPGGSILALSVLPNGGVLIGGSFNDVQGQQLINLARLDPDGRVDDRFNNGEGFNGEVSAIAVQADGKILVGGTFTMFNGVAHHGLVRLNPDGSTDPGFAAGVNGTVNVITVLPDQRIAVGGSFNSANGTANNGLVMYSSNGELDGSFAPNSGTSATAVYGIIFTTSAQLVVIGEFSQYTGYPSNGIARIGLDGYLDYSFDPGSGFDGPVYAGLFMEDGYFIAAGNFGQYNGSPSGRITKLDACAEAVWYADADGDGSGDPYSAVIACRKPLDHVLNNDDCDDTNPATQHGQLWYSDLVDMDGFGDPANSIMACSQPHGYVANNYDCFPDVVTYSDSDEDGFGSLPIAPCGPVDNTDCNDSNNRVFPGSVCDDGNPNTTNDVMDINCICAGVISCSNITLEVNTSNSGAALQWGVYDKRGNSECSAGNFPNNTDRFRSTCCIQDGEHLMKMRLVNGASGFNGSYLVRYGDSGRLLHNETGFPGTSAKHGNEGLFSLPIGSDRLVESRCDGSFPATGNLIAMGNAGVQAKVVAGNWTNQSGTTGYEFWIFDPDGGYDISVFQSLRTTNGQAGGPDYNARWLRLNGTAFSGDPLPVNRELNVRIRTRVEGLLSAWGPACRLIVNADPNVYWQVHLVDLPGDPAHSCNITSGFDVNIPVNLIHSVSITGGARYRFQWTRESDGRQFVVERASGNATSNRSMALSKAMYPLGMPNWPVDEPIPLPGESWMVRVASKKFTAANYGTYGPACTVTFSEGVAKMAHELQAGGSEEAQFALWPNPNNGRSLNLSLKNMDVPVDGISLDIHDATGRLMLQRRLSGNGQRDMEATGIGSELDPGAYVATINVGSQKFNQRLVVE